VEISGNMWKYVEICGNMWKYVEICGNMWKWINLPIQLIPQKNYYCKFFFSNRNYFKISTKPSSKILVSNKKMDMVKI